MREQVFLVGIDLRLLRELVDEAAYKAFVYEEAWQDDATGSSGTDVAMRPARLVRAEEGRFTLVDGG